MQLAVRLDKRPGESHMAFGQKKKWNGSTEASLNSQNPLSWSCPNTIIIETFLQLIIEFVNMQLAHRHDERPGESYEALDEKNIIIICSSLRRGWLVRVRCAFLSLWLKPLSVQTAGSHTHK